MGPFEIISGAVLLVACIAIIIVVMLQESKQQGLGSVYGDTESYYGKNSGRTLDAILSRITKVAMVIFFVLTMVVTILSVYLK